MGIAQEAGLVPASNFLKKTLYMNMETRYLISNNGLNIAVGVISNKQQAQEDAILAENIYGYNHSDHLFHNVLYMPSVKSFKKFLAMKEYLLLWSERLAKDYAKENVGRANIMHMTRQAITKANKIMRENVTYENFMRQIHSSITYNVANTHAENSNNEY